VTEEGLAGTEGNAFDPNNGYREAYAAIWGK
jgi:ribose transport system substrate-binding protein